LPPSAFVAFLQNHDQTGNRPFGERLTLLADPRALQAAMALLLLVPQIPMLFMGEEIGSRAPFLFFADHGPELAQAVREGRARDFAAAHGTAQGGTIPDPNDPRSFAASDPERDAPQRAQWLALVGALLALRRERVTPYIGGAKSLGAEACGEKAVIARWRLSDGARLTLAANFGTEAAPARLPAAAPFWGGAAADAIAPFSTLSWIEA
jgi:maltooligosyltrehalose trehalohydrolase